jgi:glycosyltransferase involved in cell wall biosynthesis
MIHAPVSGLVSMGSLRNVLPVRRFLKTNGVSLMQSHDVYSNFLATMWARAAGVDVTVASRRWLDSVPRKALAQLDRFSYRIATHVLSNSESIRRRMIEYEGVPAKKVTTLVNFVEADAFERVDRANVLQWRLSRGLRPDVLTIGYVGRLSEVKNLPMLVGAVRGILSDGVDAQLVVVGDGPDRGQTERLAKDALGNRVVFTGQLTNRPNLHQYFDISVLCSKSEGAPNSLIEAAAAGTPCVATNVGGVADIVQHEETGLLVTSDDVDGLAVALTRLAVDDQLRTSLGKRAEEYARETYHEDVVFTRLYELWRNLLGARR